MSDVLVRYADFRKTIAGMFSTVTQTMVDAALHYANKHLEGQTRYDGTPMLDHAVAVARIVATEVGLGRNSTVSAIIHDVVRLAAKSEDEQRIEDTLAQCKKLFGEEVTIRPEDRNCEALKKTAAGFGAAFSRGCCREMIREIFTREELPVPILLKEAKDVR